MPPLPPSLCNAGTPGEICDRLLDWAESSHIPSATAALVRDLALALNERNDVIELPSACDSWWYSVKDKDPSPSTFDYLLVTSIAVALQCVAASSELN
ncbi:hypothetical protein GCM10009551_064660 [Nocardiopsis tropica]